MLQQILPLSTKICKSSILHEDQEMGKKTHMPLVLVQMCSDDENRKTEGRG
jgi:hypothetical protein